MRIFLHILVFLSGVVSLGSEIGASRLLAPYFGTSLVVWSSLIGLILVALSVGYWLGGRWADKSPRWESLLLAELLAGSMLALIPLVSAPVLEHALLDLGHLEIGMLLGAFVGVSVLLGAPMVLMGCVTPFAIKLATTRMDTAGRTAGRLFALSTLGSFLGAFLPTVLMIPLMGTRWTFSTFGMVLLSLAFVGYLLQARWRLAGIAAAAIGVAVGIGLYMSAQPIKPGTGLVWESESPYQYVRVIRRDNGWTWLQLNEGLVVHSKFHPENKYTFGEWDYVTLAPLMAKAKDEPAKGAKTWAVIGAGAGTTARMVTMLWGNWAQIHGVELDPDVVEVGKRYFGADIPNYKVDVNDGRAWIKTNHNKYDVIAVDAYRQPYIPFELTTVEFFGEVYDHLNDDGVVVINVSRPPKDSRLVDALATTLSQVFPSVHLMHLPRSSSVTLVFGTRSPTTLADYRHNVARAGRQFGPLLARIKDRVGDVFERSLVLTDDLAPVERLMDLMLASQAIDGEWVK